MTGESILIVEDEGFIALQIKELLENNGYHVIPPTAYGEDAVTVARETSPDLICMDIELMGKMDGIEAARKIHEHADIPVIFLTSYTDSQRLERAKEAVPYSYIVKPFIERELLASIGMALYRHGIDRKLRESEERYRAIVDNAAEGIILFSVSTRKIVEANPAVLRILGYPAGEIAAMTIDELVAKTAVPGVSPDIAACTPEGWSGETRFRSRDGSVRDLELVCRPIRQGNPPDLCCLVAHDITDRKLAETALTKANRRLSLLSSITRHDIINQLTVLHGFLELSRSASAGTRLGDYAEREIEVATTIRRLINFTKDYEEIGQHKPAWFRPETIIRHLAEMTVLPGISVVSRLSGLEVYADPLLERVFDNLLDNAVRHGGNVRTITVTAERNGSGLIIRWEDDGNGIPDNEKERIFERGFGKNTGLGLFLSREILSLTGISIRENGTWGSGARFELSVPPGAFRYPVDKTGTGADQGAQ